jgi:hypothetical protein
MPRELVFLFLASVLLPDSEGQGSSFSGGYLPPREGGPSLPRDIFGSGEEGWGMDHLGISLTGLTVIDHFYKIEKPL